MSYHPMNEWCLVDSLTCEPGFPREWSGLDLATAEEVTPRWYGVSFSNGNDGVSQMWPNYYVRTCEPYVLANAAMLSQFCEGEGQSWAAEEMYINGEADYTIGVTILDPPPDDSEDTRDHSECEDGEDCEGCAQCEPDDMDSYSSANGAWMICEVFHVESPEDNNDR